MTQENTRPTNPVQQCVPQPSLDVEAIQREIAAGYINEQPHPSAPLRILNYSQQVQFDWRWNAETMAAFATIEATARGQMTVGGSRKEIAERFMKCQYPSVMFAMLDGKDYAAQVWRMLRPSGKAFRCDVDA